MPARPPERARLAELTEARRQELGLTWEQVARAGGTSYETIRAARNDDNGIRTLTRRAIATGLRWTPNSVDLILAGGDPVPVADTMLSAVQDEPPFPVAAAGDPVIAALVNAWPERALHRALRVIWSVNAPLEDRRQALAEVLPPPAEEVGEAGDALVAAFIGAWPDKENRGFMRAIWRLPGASREERGRAIEELLQRGDPKAGERGDNRKGNSA